MSQNTYCKPKLFIEDVGIIEDVTGSVIFPGTSQICSLKVTIPGINQAEAAMMNKEIKFYLNNGSDDVVPYFIGYIKQFKSSDTKTEIIAFDSRCFLGGEYAQSIELSDDDNYDGFTLGQFLFKHINDNINKHRNYLDLSLLNDTNPPVPMKGARVEDKPYSIVLKLLKEAVDDVDIFDLFDYELGVSFSNRGTSLKFIKQKPLNDSCMTFSYGDGIQSYTCKKRKLANRGVVGNVVVDLHSTNYPRITKEVEDKLEKNLANRVKEISPAFLAKETLKGLLHDRKDKYVIQLQATKGHYLELGSVINLNVDEEFKGNHRVTSKTLNFSPNGIKLLLQLNTRPLTMTFNNSY